MKRNFRRLISIILSIILSLLIVVSSFASDVAASPNYEENLKQKVSDLQSRYKQLEKEQKDWENAVAKAKNKASEYQAYQDAVSSQIDNTLEQVEVINEQIALIDDQLNVLNTRILKKQTEIDTKQKEYDENMDQFRTRLRAMYISDQSSSILTVLFGADSFYDLLSRVEVLNRISNANTELMDEIVEEKNDIQKVQDDLIADKEETEVLREENVAIQSELNKKVENLDSQFSQLSDEIELCKKQEAVYKANAASIQKDLDAAQAEIAAVYKQFTSNYDEYIGGEFAWPLPGFSYISSYYGWRFGGTDFHTGIDITGGNVYGSDIVAANSGEVIFVQTTYVEGKGYGKYIILDHGGDYTTLYGHCSSVLVNVGDIVSRGQTIAKVGSTGWSTGPHLHFEIRIDGSHTDPCPYLGIASGKND